MKKIAHHYLILKVGIDICAGKKHLHTLNKAIVSSHYESSAPQLELCKQRVQLLFQLSYLHRFYHELVYHESRMRTLSGRLMFKAGLARSIFSTSKFSV